MRCPEPNRSRIPAGRHEQLRDKRRAAPARAFVRGSRPRNEPTERPHDAQHDHHFDQRACVFDAPVPGREPTNPDSIPIRHSHTFSRFSENVYAVWVLLAPRPVRHNARAAPRTPIRKEPAGPKPAGSDRPPAIPRLPSDELPKQRRRAATLFLAARLHKGGEAQRFPGVSLSAVPAAGANGGAARRSDAAASGAGPTVPAPPPESP